MEPSQTTFGSPVAESLQQSKRLQKPYSSSTGDKGTGLGHSLGVTEVDISRLPVLSPSAIHELFFPGACVPTGVGLGVKASVPSLHLYFLFLLIA